MRYAVTGSTDRTLRFWDLSRGLCAKTMRASSTCNSVDISGDGVTCISGHQDGVVRVWDLREGKRTAEVRDQHSAQITSVQFSPRDGLAMLTNSRDNHLKIIDARSMVPIHTLTHDGFRTAFNWSKASFSADGTMVIAGAGNGGVYIWNALSGGLETVLHAHEKAVAGCAWSPTGQMAASCDQDGHLVLWD